MPLTNKYTRQALKNSHRCVVKIGSALLTNDGNGLDTQAMMTWAEQLNQLNQQGIEIVLVSSGAIAEGIKRLQWSKRPKELCDLQAAAAVGQMGLVQSWESAFQKYQKHTAQVLLTHDDLSNRTRYLNARSTICRLLNLGIIPIVNENDTVVTDEIRFGDNDTLAALVANLIEADVLIILTDQQGMYDRDPRQDNKAKLLDEVDVEDEELDSMAGDSKGILGSGGMATKLSAARLAARSGTATIIASGRTEKGLKKIFSGESIGTFLKPSTLPMLARKQWLAAHLKTKGYLQLDDGAAKVLKHNGSSLLAIGVTKVEGNFKRGDMLVCLDQNGQEVARGLSNYSADETNKIKQHPSFDIEQILGYCNEPELIHRDNLVLL